MCFVLFSFASLPRLPGGCLSKCLGGKRGRVCFQRLPAATYGVWECLEVPLGDICGATVIAMGKPSQIFTALLVNNLCCYSLSFFQLEEQGGATDIFVLTDS